MKSINAANIRELQSLIQALSNRVKSLEDKLRMHIDSPTGEGHTFKACENCGSIHAKRTLKPKVDISNVVFKLCPHCYENWGK